ncbi:MAG: arginine repressor [Candidatus Delongbacteria bacterium]|nr:arginine repressor [Candidatus Delongbacteria bacterium]
MKKDKRRHLILQILKKQSLNTQDDLVRELAKRGIKVTQATLSRDLAQIGAIRVPHPGGSRYQIPGETLTAKRQVVPSQVLDITWNEMLIVMKTLTGCAPSVAFVIDSWNCPEIMGTLAGDDTILIIPKTTKSISQIVQYLEDSIFPNR